MTRFLSITTMRNEGAFLLEWLSYHRAVGFTDFLIFSNDCDDGTDVMLDRLQAMGLVTHVRNEGPFPKGPQWAALHAAEHHPLTRAADWILVHDVDEFVNIHVGARRLPDLIEAMPEADCIAMSWRMFGNGGAIEYEDVPVLETFTGSAPATLCWPWRATLIKTLFRNSGHYARPGVHRPRDGGAEARWCDGSGRRLPDQYRDRGQFVPLGRDNGQIVQLNHYALGWMESYVVKCDRGRANRAASPFDMSYWIDRNFSDVEDRTILSLPREPIEDAALSDLHRRAVAWRKARFRDLMQNEEWQALFGRLLMAPPSRVLPPRAVSLILRHRQG